MNPPFSVRIQRKTGWFKANVVVWWVERTSQDGPATKKSSRIVELNDEFLNCVSNYQLMRLGHFIEQFHTFFILEKSMVVPLSMGFCQLIRNASVAAKSFLLPFKLGFFFSICLSVCLSAVSFFVLFFLVYYCYFLFFSWTGINEVGGARQLSFRAFDQFLVLFWWPSFRLQSRGRCFFLFCFFYLDDD